MSDLTFNQEPLMATIQLPTLRLKDWKETRDILHQYFIMIGTLKEKMSQPHPHWWHISLRVSDLGLTTTPIPKNKDTPDQTFEVIFDLKNNYLLIESNYREVKRIIVNRTIYLCLVQGNMQFAYRYWRSAAN